MKAPPSAAAEKYYLIECNTKIIIAKTQSRHASDRLLFMQVAYDLTQFTKYLNH